MRARVIEPLEKFIQRDIQKLLCLLGAKVYVLGTRRARGDQQGTRQSPGLPDLIAFLPARLPSRRSRIVLIEVKRIGNDLSQAQFDFQTLCQRADIAYITGNLDRILTWLTAEGYLHARSIRPSCASAHTRMLADKSRGTSAAGGTTDP
jgi:hypothetical protein